MYKEKLLEEFYNPANVGVIKGANAVSKVKGGACGEIVKFYAVVENKTVVDVKFQAFGNVVLIAAASAATKLMMGKTFDEIITINAEQLKAELGGAVSANKVYSLNLVEEAIGAMIANYFKKTQGSVPEEYKLGSIVNSDEVGLVDDEDEVEEKPVAPKKKPVAKKAKVEKKPVKEVEDVVIDDEDDDETIEDEAEEKEVEASKPTKKVTRTVKIYNDLDEDELSDLDDLTSSISDALKKLNETEEE